MRIVLDERLKAAADMCRSGAVVADVGTDHARLACYLAENGAKAVIASDIKEGPLKAARKTIEACGAKNVTTVLSDGLSAVGYADDVVICGMGGELIADIIKGCRFLSENTRFILQPMTKADFLRRRLYAEGFEIIEERGAAVSGHVYTVMLARFTGVRREIDDVFAAVGMSRDPRYRRHVADKLLKNAEGMERSEGASAAAAKLRECAERILRDTPVTNRGQ